jgi:hypothetical protein
MIGAKGWAAVRWFLFYVGLFLSPLTPGNDAIVNQLPSSLLAAAIAHKSSGPSYHSLYVLFYVASNILGLLLMLVNYPELKLRWARLVRAWREKRSRFVWLVIADIAAFAFFFFVGRLAVSIIG